MDGVAIEANDQPKINLNSNLPIPSVQEIAKQGLEIVPERYIMDIDHYFIASDPSIVVPLIDMTKLLNNDGSELQKFHSACKDWGLFQLINHGVPNEVVKAMKKQVQEFFELPLEEKKRSAQKPGSSEGYGHAFVTSEHQKQPWNDMINLQTLPVQSRNMSLWPQKPPSFREAIGKYSENMRELAVYLMKIMAKALELEDEELISRNYQEGNYMARMNYYPPCPEPERVVGIRPHADITGITLLLECGDTPGLQVLKDAQWIIIEPIDGAIVVNLGQIIEVISNGIYKAPEHRAMVNRMKERISVVTFCFPNPSAMIGPDKQLIIKSGSPPLYKTVTNEESFHLFINRKHVHDPFFEKLTL